MAKKLDAWMPLYIGDYLADTARLTTEQHGAYLLLLMDYWRNGPPPDDEDVLASITKLTVVQWRKHAPAIGRLFTSTDGTWVQKRAESERQKASGIGGKRRESGKAGAAKRWGKPGGEPMANGMANGMASGVAGGLQNDASAGTPSQSQSQPKACTEPCQGGGYTLDGADADGPAGPDEPAGQGGAGSPPSAYGAISRAIRQAGIGQANPAGLRFRALVDAGATAEEFLAFVPKALAVSGDRWAYVVGCVEGERKRGVALQGQLRQGTMPAVAVTVPSADAERTAAYLREQADRGQTKPPAAVKAWRAGKGAAA